MQNYKFFYMLRLAAALCSALPLLFWMSVLLAFDEIYVAVLSIIAIMTHEAGHLLVYLFLGKKCRLLAKLDGLRISGHGSLSHTSQLAVYAAGPSMNILAAITALPLIENDYFKALFAVQIMYAVSNLLPIRGSDGYGIIDSICNALGDGYKHGRLLDSISLLTVILLSYFSLYVMVKLNSGYWMYFIFLTQLISHLVYSNSQFREKTRVFKSIREISGDF